MVARLRFRCLCRCLPWFCFLPVQRGRIRWVSNPSFPQVPLSHLSKQCTWPDCSSPAPLAWESTHEFNELLIIAEIRRTIYGKPVCDHSVPCVPVRVKTDAMRRMCQCMIVL